MLKVLSRRKWEDDRDNSANPKENDLPPSLPPLPPPSSAPIDIPSAPSTPCRPVSSSVSESNPSRGLIWSSPRRHVSGLSSVKVTDSESSSSSSSAGDQQSLLRYFSAADCDDDEKDRLKPVASGGLPPPGSRKQIFPKELFSPSYQKKDSRCRLLRSRRGRNGASRPRSGSEPVPMAQRKIDEYAVRSRPTTEGVTSDGETADEGQRERMSTEGDEGDEEEDEAGDVVMSPPAAPTFDDFVRLSEEYTFEFPRDVEEELDPIFFIRNLRPIPHSALPRVPCLPKKTRSGHQLSVVLDLDETLVHCSTEPLENADMSFEVATEAFKCTVYVMLRPFCLEFLAEASKAFEVIVFTASQSAYADLLLNHLDPERRLVRHRLFREECVSAEGNFLKDLRVLGRELAHTVIVDNSPQAFAAQIENGIPITSWFDDENDRELPKLMKFLKTLSDTDDVRPALRRRFKIQDLVNHTVR